jgi:hypothetical protein
VPAIEVKVPHSCTVSEEYPGGAWGKREWTAVAPDTETIAHRTKHRRAQAIKPPNGVCNSDLKQDAECSGSVNAAYEDFNFCGDPMFQTGL